MEILTKRWSLVALLVFVGCTGGPSACHCEFYSDQGTLMHEATYDVCYEGTLTQVADAQVAEVCQDADDCACTCERADDESENRCLVPSP